MSKFTNLTGILPIIKFAQQYANGTFVSQGTMKSINLKEGDLLHILLARSSFIDTSKNIWYICLSNIDTQEVYCFTINQLKTMFTFEGPITKDLLLDQEFASNVVDQLTPLIGKKYKVNNDIKELSIVKGSILTLQYYFDGTPTIPVELATGKNWYIAFADDKNTMCVINYELFEYYFEEIK